MAKYLITGACGFLGSALSMHLAKIGHSVIGFDQQAKTKPLKNDHITLIHGDINDSEAICSAMAEVEGCFHLAALPSVYQSYLNWLGTHKINATGTISVLDAAYRVRPTKPVPVVYMSSSSVYGFNQNKPLSEDTFPSPCTPYAADKAACEYYAGVASKLYHVPCLGFRLFNAYGAGADPTSPYSGVTIQFLNCILENKPFEIYGDGLQTRDFVYIDDVVEALLIGMQKVDLQHKVYNICSGISCSILELATLLNEITNKSLSIQFSPPRMMDTRHSQGNPEKAKLELKFVTKIPLKEGLLKSLSGLNNHFKFD